MANTRQIVREWLENLIDKTGASPRALALKAKVSPSTIYRALDDDANFTPSMTTIDKVADAYNVAPPSRGQAAANQYNTGGFSDAELTPLSAQPIGAGNTANNDQSDWVIRTRALELSGVLPGDTVTFDMSIPPKDGDIACAQVYSFGLGSADTVIRLVRGPFLITKSADPSVDDEPLFVDGKRVVCMGTMTRLKRERVA